MTNDRERSFKVDAIVLGRRDYGETDRIVTLLTRERGKLSAIAKGARKPTARSGPAIEYFAHSRFMLARGRDLDVVTSAELIARPANLQGSLSRLANASHMAELANKLVQEGEVYPVVFQLLLASLHQLDDGNDDLRTVRCFEVQILSEVGYPLDLWHCSTCQRELGQELNYLGLASGGMLCPDCRSNEGKALAVSINAQKYLRLLSREGLKGAAQVLVPSTVAAETERVMAAYTSSVVERDLTSLRVLREIRERSGTYSV
ncbi:MAG: DNA repair protein RecO [Thermomicrobiales bacterium]